MTVWSRNPILILDSAACHPKIVCAMGERIGEDVCVWGGDVCGREEGEGGGCDRVDSCTQQF